MTFVSKKVVGVLLCAVGGLGMAGLLFFYGVVLFSDDWSFLQKTNEALRIAFSIPEGLLVMYASFIALAIPCFFAIFYGAELWFEKTYVTKFQAIALLLIWFVAVCFGFITTVVQMQELAMRLAPFGHNAEDMLRTEDTIPVSTRYVFKTTLKSEVVRTQGVPALGYEPDMFIKAFPGLTISDFDGVEASIGNYILEKGKLVHKMDEGKLVHDAARAITDRGLDTLLDHVSTRLGVDLSKEGTLTEIMDALIVPKETAGGDGVTREEVPVITPPPVQPAPDEVFACTMDAKICPDGSAVGRVGPNCEFTPCPTASATHTCTEQERNRACTKEYAPVCGLVSIQCVTTPCNPVPETFGNGCSACSSGNVISYTKGACGM